MLQNLFFNFGNKSFRIIYYHMVNDICPDYYFKNKCISADKFRKQIRFFNKKYKIISLYEAINIIRKGKSLSNCLSITIDDGFVENYNIVAPILVEQNATATFFLIADCIDNKHLMWRNKLLYLQNKLGPKKTKKIITEYSKSNNLRIPLRNENILSWSLKTWNMRNKDRLADQLWNLAEFEPVGSFLERCTPYLTVNQIKALINEGFDIGCHTKTHPDCSKLSYDELEEEIIGAAASISGKIKKKIDLFSYPFSSRANLEVENKIINHPYKIKAILGIKSRLENNNNPYRWERDYQESAAMLKFSILPFLRKFKLIKH